MRGERREMKKKIIDFNPNGLRKLYFFTENLNYPVVIALYSEQEEARASYLLCNIQSGIFNSESICKWCIAHHIQYRIIYPLKKVSILKNPYKYYKFIQLKRKLKYCL